MIRKYINKLELNNQCPHIRVKDKNMSEIEDNLYVRSVMNMTPVFQIKRELRGSTIILRNVNDGMYTCSSSVRYEE